MSILKQALDALAKAEYAQIFSILDKAKITSPELNLLRKEVLTEGIKTFSYDRFKLAIEDAFKNVSIPSFLLYLPASSSNFIGRNKELQELHDNLQAGKRTVLVNGLGGVGKTSLAQKYIHTYQNDYAHILWIRQNGHLIASFFQKELFDNLGLEIEKQEIDIEKQEIDIEKKEIDIKKQENTTKVFDNVLAALRKKQGINLFIIDNYEFVDTNIEKDSLNKIFALPTNWRIVCTSRTDVSLFEKTMRLGVLPTHEAIQVFKQHAVGKPQDDIEIDALLQTVGYHTLMTELLAKTYLRCLQFGTVGKFHDFLKEKGLQDVYLDKKIFVEGQPTTLYKHLSKVFALAKLTADELWILKQWTVLSTAPHQASDFLTWIQDTDLAYENTLLSLAEKGWLQTEDYLAYTLHPFLQLFLHQTLKPTLPDCEKMWDYFTNLMYSKEIKANPLAYQWTIAIGEAMEKHIDFDIYEKGKSILLERVAFVYIKLGNYLKATEYVEKSLKIEKEWINEQDVDYVALLNQLAWLYDRMGDYEKSLPLHQETLNMNKEKFGIWSPEYATSLNNFGSSYSEQGIYTEALPLLQEALKIRKEILGEQHSDYGQSLNNLGLFYHKQKNYTEALPLYQKALQIRKEISGERHPDVAQSLHNIGGLYFQQKDYQQAKQYLEEAYSIRLEKLGEQHSLTQNTKKWLDDLPNNV